MENFKIKISETTYNEIELPKYIRIGSRMFIKIINQDYHIHVSLFDKSADLYPEIEYRKNNLLGWFAPHQWDAITEEEFYTAYYESKNYIEKYGEI
jgi:hypothetical protein